jgi:hypothetical protein
MFPVGRDLGIFTFQVPNRGRVVEIVVRPARKGWRMRWGQRPADCPENWHQPPADCRCRSGQSASRQFRKKCTLNRWKRRVRSATLCDIRVPGLRDRLRLYFRIRLALIRSLALGRRPDILSRGACCEIEIPLRGGAKILHDDALSRAIMDDDGLRVRFRTSSRVTKLSQHEADGGKFQEREGVAVEIFPILGETATTTEPCDGSFDDPTLG